MRPPVLQTPGRRGVSSPIATVLLVALALVLVGATATFVLDLDETLTEPAPQTSVSATVLDDEVRFTHRGGGSVNVSELDLVVETADESKRVPFADGRLSGTDSAYTAGETWRYCQRSTAGERVTLRLVHEASQAVLATVERSAEATAHQGLEYQCASTQYQYNGDPGWTAFNLTNYGPGDVTIAEMTVQTDGAEHLTETSQSVAVYVDADSDFDYYDPPDGYVGFAPSTDLDVRGGVTVDFSSSGAYRAEPTIGDGTTAWISLFRFTDVNGDPADMAGATVTVTVELSDGTTHTYTMVVPTGDGA